MNKHLRNIIDEYLLTKQPFEDELLKMTESIFRNTSIDLYYSNHFRPRDSYNKFRCTSKISRCNDTYYTFFGQWAIRLEY